MRLGTDTGSLTNYLMSGPTKAKADREVGMGVTMLSWTDRHAGTIVKITPKQIHVQRDEATRIDKNGMSESQEYSYLPISGAPIEIFRLTKRGWRSASYSGLAIGVRDEYYDYSF